MDKIIRFEAFKQIVQPEQERNPILIYNLGDVIPLTVDGRSFQLENDDLILINPMENVQFEAVSAPFYILFTIDRRLFSQIFGGKNFTFNCNSAAEKNDDYNLLRKLLSSLITTSFEQSPYSTAEYHKMEMEILILIVSSFAITKHSLPKNARVEAITDYISVIICPTV